MICFEVLCDDFKKLNLNKRWYCFVFFLMIFILIYRLEELYSNLYCICVEVVELFIGNLFILYLDDEILLDCIWIKLLIVMCEKIKGYILIKVRK